MIGKADQRITFQRFAETADGIGGSTQAWANLASVPTVWAKVTPRIGNERMEDGRMNASMTATFMVRYRADITELDRIVWRGESWNIRRVMRKSGANLWLEIDAERGVAQ
jgi:SPP1 family predicted phage head-tail adaptor